MINRNNVPKFNKLKKREKMMIVSSLFLAVSSIVLLFLSKTNVIKISVHFFGFALSIVLLSIVYYKYDRITAIVGFLLMFLFIGMGLKELGL